jgi:uncharacterized protein
MKELLELARLSISSIFSNETIDIDTYNQTEKQGCFVTLKKNKELRGCIGFPIAVLPLNEAIFQAARAAAFEDPRFPPVTESEFEEIKIEVSILTIPEEVKKPYEKNIKIGEDGLIIKDKNQSGLLLPQVAPEWNWNVTQFLEHTCEKAGLEKEAYKDDNTTVEKFQAKIYTE